MVSYIMGDKITIKKLQKIYDFAVKSGIGSLSQKQVNKLSEVKKIVLVSPETFKEVKVVVNVVV